MTKFFSLPFVFIVLGGISDFSTDYIFAYPDKSQYETNKKASIIDGNSYQVISYLSNNSISQKTGSVIFNFDDVDDVYMPSEAPLNAEIFLNTVWDNNIDTFITLTTESDNNSLKLWILRDSIPIDLHYLYNIANKENTGFFITYPKVIEGVNGLRILQSEILKGNEIRTLTQILCYHWYDRTLPDRDTFDFIIEMANKYHKNSKSPLFINCFLGVGRTRFLIMGLHATKTHKNLDNISNEYFNKNYNKKTVEKGEFLSHFRDKQSNYYLTLKNYVE